MTLVCDEAELDRWLASLDWSVERNRPGALRATFLAAKREEDDSLNGTCDARFDRETEYQAIRLVRAERQAELMSLRLLPPQRSDGRLLCEPAVEAHRHLFDEEDEVMAVVQHLQPRMDARGGGTPKALLSEGVGAAPDRPAVIAHLVCGKGDGVSPCVG